MHLCLVSALAGLLDCGYRLLDRFKGLSDLSQAPVNLRQRDEKLWPIYPGSRRSIDVKCAEYLGNPLVGLSLLGQSPSSNEGCNAQKEREAMLRADLNCSLRGLSRCLLSSTKLLNHGSVTEDVTKRVGMRELPRQRDGFVNLPASLVGIAQIPERHSRETKTVHSGVLNSAKGPRTPFLWIVKAAPLL